MPSAETQASFPIEFGLVLMTGLDKVTATHYNLISDRDLHQLSTCISASNKGGSWQPGRWPGGDFRACRAMAGSADVRNEGHPEQLGKARDVGQNETVFCVTWYGSGAPTVPVSQKPPPDVRAGCEHPGCLKPCETDPEAAGRPITNFARGVLQKKRFRLDPKKDPN